MCESTSIEPHMEVTDHSISKEDFELWQCSDCSFVFTQNPPSSDSCGRYYESEEYISHSDTKSSLRDKLYHRARAYMLERKWKIVNTYAQIGGQGTLLDMGAGTGYFMNYVHTKGWRVQGIEMSANARSVGEQKFGLKSLPPEHLWKFSDQFDVITLWHVLEHLYDFHKYVARFHELLLSRGLLVIAVPNRSSKDARYYGSEWAAYDVPRHLWHFVPGDMEKIATKHGFQLVDQYPMPLDAFYVSMLSEQYKNGAPLIGGSIRGLASNFNAWSTPHESSSLIYILRKS